MTELAPKRQLPDARWEHFQLYDDIKETLQALPSSFTSEMQVTGVMATDIFTLNSAFGAMIEEQVVESLNRARQTWDPNGDYSLYPFVRQAQRFPDVLLKRPGSNEDIILGIELKGWYLLSKEGEPSFRFMTTPAACAPADLVVVVPWVLSNIISGEPKVFPPYIESAKYAAEYRNYYWQNIRQSKYDRRIVLAENASPYPTKTDKISDVAAVDGGGNFGRFARTGLMDDYQSALMDQPLRGIPAKYWLRFFKAFQDQSSQEKISSALDALVGQVSAELEKEEKNPQLEVALRLIEDLKALILD